MWFVALIRFCWDNIHLKAARSKANVNAECRSLNAMSIRVHLVQCSHVELWWPFKALSRVWGLSTSIRFVSNQIVKTWWNFYVSLIISFPKWRNVRAVSIFLISWFFHLSRNFHCPPSLVWSLYFLVVSKVSAVQCIICPALAIRKYREMCILSPSLWKWPNAEKRDSISNRIEKKLNPKWHLIQAADMSEPNHFCCSSLDSKTLQFVKSSFESIFYRRILSIAKYKTDIMKIRYHQFFFLSSKCQIRFWER